MADNPLPASFIGLLARHVAKLCEQLRHSLSGSSGTASGGAERYATFNRLRASAATLSVAGAKAGPLAELATPLHDFVAILADDPQRLPRHLLAPSTRLASHLEEVLERMDRGESPGAVVSDPAWEALLGAFLNAGTLLEDLDRVEEIFTEWARRHGDADLSRSQEQALRSRWGLLRDYGDSLFGASDPRTGRFLATVNDRPDGTVADLAGVSVVLLLASPFRRDQVREILAAAGCEVEPVSDPDQVLQRIGDPEPPELVLCDNLEPSRHLAAVRTRLGGLAAEDRPPLVLVTTAGDPADRLLERAKHLGAQGVWAAPWPASELRAWLSC